MNKHKKPQEEEAENHQVPPAGVQVDNEKSERDTIVVHEHKKEDEPQDHIGSAPKPEEPSKKTVDYDALWEKYLRNCAEFDNARKRWDKERQQLIKFANYSLVRDLVVTIDELEHALSAIKEHSGSEEILKGVQLTYNNLLTLLKKEGLKAIQAQGKKFDPHIHEIVGQRQDGSVDEHTVLEEVQKGYFLGDKVLRTSKVIIAVSANEPDAADDNGSLNKPG